MKFKELLVIYKDSPDDYEEFSGTHSITYKNVTLNVTNQHLILMIEKDDESGSFIDGEIVELKSIKNFRGWQ
jgi:hypothetical protein